MAGPSSPDQKPFSGVDALAHGRAKEIGTVTVKTGETDTFSQSITLGQELAGIKASQGGGEVIASLERTKRRSFDLSRQTALRTRFGAGRAELNTRGGIKINTEGLDSADRAYVDANSRSAERVIGQVSSVLNYTEILLESQRSGKTPDAILAERKIKGTTWADLRKTALGAIIDTDAIRGLVPDLDKLSDLTEQQRFIEEALAKDPTFHSKLADRMIAIEARTREFTSSAADGELSVHQEISKASKEAIATAARDAVDKMVAAGFAIPDVDVQLQTIQKMLETGTNPDQIPAQILTAVRAQQLGARPDMAIVEGFYAAKAKYDALLPRMKGIKSLPAAAQVRLQDEFDKADIALTAAETKYTGLSDPVVSEQNLIALNGLLSAKSENGIYSSPIAQDLAGGVSARKRMSESEQAYKKKAIVGREKESDARSQRLAEESAVISDMESVLSDAITDVLSERLDEMKRLDVVAQQKRVEELEEVGNKDQAEAVKKVGTAMESNWSSLNQKDRKRKIDRDKIGSDVRVLAYRGQEGVKSLIRRDMVSGGQVMLDGAMVTVNTMTPDQLKKFDELVDSVYQQEGYAYAKRLFADFVEARQLGGRAKNTDFVGNLKSLGLKDHEWGLLAKNFEGMISPQDLNSPDAARLMEEMKKQGIDTRKGGFLTMLFLLLAGGVVLTGKGLKKVVT